MSKKVKNPTELSGLLGERLSIKKSGGRVLVTNRPTMKGSRPMSEKMLAFQQKFKEAAHYAKQELADKETRELYEQRVTDKKRSAFTVALVDYLTPPEITFIDAVEYDGTVGSTILIKAIDDFMVEGVTVLITDKKGNVLEKGGATPTSKLYLWKYTATAANPSLAGTVITAVAFDRPGNKTALEVTL